jgi:hypothetical protein
MRAVRVVMVGAVLGVTAAAQTQMKPGSYEVTMQMEMANMPMKMPEMKMTHCITPEQLKNPGGILPSSGPAAPSTNTCKVSDHKVTGNTASWKMSCPPPQKMDGTAEVAFKDDSYNAKMTMTTDKGTMTMKYAGKRLGECK